LRSGYGDPTRQATFDALLAEQLDGVSPGHVKRTLVYVRRRR